MNFEVRIGESCLEELFISKEQVEMYSNRATMQLNSCPVCMEEFTNLELLNIHVMTVERNKRYKFESCIFTAKSPVRLVKHKSKIHSTFTLQCTVCCQNFRKQKMLYLHIKDHVIKQNKFSCGICPKVFKDEKQLKWNKRSHQG